LKVIELQPDKANYIKRIDVNNTTADKVSDGMLGTGVVIPVILLAFSGPRHDLGKVGMLYLETMAFTGMSYALGAGFIDKYRPYFYSPDVPFSKRMSDRARYSFFAGHTAMTAAGTFFTAKVFSDYYPESKWKYVMWAGATAVTLTSGYYRYNKGYHFPEDVAIGILIGAGAGILIPEFHKKKIKNLSVTPAIGKFSGICGVYKF